MTQPTLLTAADTADALLVLRRAKSTLFLIILLALLGQLALFFIARYTDLVIPSATTTQPAEAGGFSPYRFATAVTIVATLGGTAVLTILLLSTLMVTITARTLGQGRLASAVAWVLFLLVIVFPWQMLLNAPINYKVPSVLFTIEELTSAQRMLSAKFPDEMTEQTIYRWVRYVLYPVIALVVLMFVQVKSSRGLRMALGEDRKTTKTTPPVSSPPTVK